MSKTVKVSDNDIVVKKRVKKNIKAKGNDWFSEPYCNIFLLAKKKSGKTVTIENILRRTAGDNTTFIFIVPTINKDQTWIEICKYWEDNGNDVLKYDDLIDDEGVNVIEEFLSEQEEEAEVELDKKQEELERKNEKKEVKVGGRFAFAGVPSVSSNTSRFKIMPIIPKVGEIHNSDIKELMNSTMEIPRGSIVSEQKGGNLSNSDVNEDDKKKKKKEKVIVPEFIIVMDDLGASMRNKIITQLTKTNRHYKTKVIMSGQNMHDLMPAAIQQLDYVLVFGKQPDEIIEKLHDQLRLSIDKNKFEELYKNATTEPFSFLYIDRTKADDEFRKKFTDKYK